MKTNKQFLTPNRYSRPQTPLKKVTKAVIHYVANPMSTAQNNRDYFNNLRVGVRNQYGRLMFVSSHYVVGLEGEVIQCIPENEVAYCSESANGYSISIENCHPTADGHFNAATYKSLVVLTADICKRYDLNPLTDVIRHYDVTGTGTFPIQMNGNNLSVMLRLALMVISYPIKRCCTVCKSVHSVSYSTQKIILMRLKGTTQIALLNVQK